MDNEAYRQTFTDTGDGSNGQYGNMSCTPAGPGCVAFTYNVAKNQISNAGYSYGARGNLTGDGTYTYSWDPEAHLTAVYQSGNVVSLSTYNALGQRVEDITPTNTTDEAYGAGGNLLLRYTGDSNSRSFVPFNGRILAEYFCGGMIFDHPDEIGSLTTSTDCTGNYVNEKLFYPFGESWTGAAMPSLGMHQTFAQLPDYDAETDQYNTLFRHYTPGGRWMSPDPLAGDVTNPQSLNRYAYVLNNPTSLTDPSGLQPPGCPQGMNTQWCYGGVPGFWAGGVPTQQFSLPPTWNEFNATFYTTYSNETGFNSFIDPNGLALLAELPLGLPFDLQPLAPIGCPSSKTYSAAFDFASSNLTAAQTIADQLLASAAEILGLASVESNNGVSNLSLNYNNYFGLTVGPAFGGTIDTYNTSDGRSFGVYPSPGFLNLGLSFAESLHGGRVLGTWYSPQSFVNALTNVPRAFNSELGTAAKYLSRISLMSVIIPCLGHGR